MEMIDLGRKYGETMGVEVEVESDEKVIYPSLYVGNVKMADGMSVGDECVCQVKLKKVMEREDSEGYSCEYKVLKMGKMDSPKRKSFEEALKEQYEE